MTGDMDRLDQLLDQARAAPKDWPDGSNVSDDFMARVMADAAAEMPRRGAIPDRARPGVIGAMIGAIGGWTAVSGLAAATVAGVYIGVASPDALNAVWSGDGLSVSLYPDFESFDTGFGVEG